jgi:hypothetical protein
MALRQIGGFNAPSTDPLAANVVSATGIIAQTNGVFSLASAGQSLAAGEWTGQHTFNETVLQLQSDNAPSNSFNGTVLDTSATAITCTINQNTATNKFQQNAISPFSTEGYSMYFQDTANLTYSSIGLTVGATNNFTIEGWIYLYAYPTAAAGYHSLLKNTAATVSRYWEAGVNQSGKAVFYWNDGADKSAVARDTIIPLNQWVFLQFRSINGNLGIAVNGRGQILSGTEVLTTPSTVGIYSTGSDIGAQANYSVFNLRVSNSSRSYYMPTEPLTADANTKLLVLSTGILRDYSTTNATLTQSATLPYCAPFTPFRSDYSMFDTGSFYHSGGSSISAADNAAIDMSASDFTIEMFVFPYTTLTGGLLGKRATTAQFAGINMVATSNAVTATSTVNGTTYGVTITSAANAIQVLAWNHIAFVRSGTTWTLYINGQSTGTPVTLAGAIPDSASAMTIGSSNVANSDYITACLISNVRVIKGTAIAYSTPASIPTAPLSADANTTFLLRGGIVGQRGGLMNSAQGVAFTALGTTFPTTNVAPQFVKYGTGSANLIATSSLWGTTPTAQMDTLRFNTGEFTIEAWVYLKTPNTAYGLVSYGSTTALGWSLAIDATMRFTFNYAASTLTIGGQTLRLNTWTHVAVVRTSVGPWGITAYVNGYPSAVLGTAQSNFDSPSTTGVYIGAARDNTGFINAYLEDVRVSKLARYKRTFTPPPIGFTRQ